jgi:hypothetical protein
MIIYIRKMAVNGKKNVTESTANIPRPRRMRYFIVIGNLPKIYIFPFFPSAPSSLDPSPEPFFYLAKAFIPHFFYWILTPDS